MQIKTADDVRQLGTILGIWAHPDDESFMMAGLMAMARDNGQTVACVTATKGEKGAQDKTQWQHLGELRAAELEAALDILGVKEHHWLGYIDGECYKISDEEAIDTLQQFMTAYAPDTIITFAPDGSTGHPDHMAVSRWARLAAERAAPRARVLFAVDTVEEYEAYLRELDEKFNIYFNVDAPSPVPKQKCDIVLCLTPEIAARKFDALAAMPSQTKGMLNTIGKETFQQIVDCEAFVDCRCDHQWATPKTERLTY